MKPKSRTETGSMMVLILCLTIVVIIPIFILMCKLGPYLIFNGRAQNVVDAAGMIAAQDLSKVVIDDPNFGFVSLSNHPAVGRATKAQDGEPLPVTGINTIVGTLRQNALVASHIHNDKMNELIDIDMANLQFTINHLNNTLANVLIQNSDKAIDIEGKAVRPIDDVTSFLSQNLPPNLKLESVKLSSGWLDGGSETEIAAPQPTSLAETKTQDIEGGKYQAFKSIPVGKRSFSFAGLGQQAHLVSARNFREADSKHICSIVKLECTVVSRDDNHTKTDYVVCCQPHATSDQSPMGAMTLRFPGHTLPGAFSWAGLLSHASFRDNKVTAFQVFGGDFPFEKDARMYATQNETPSCTADQFAEHLYYWLRNAHLRPSLGAVLAMINEPFSAGSNEVYSYQLSDNGNIIRNTLSGSGFTRPVCADGQKSIMADTCTSSGANAIIYFRDNVLQQGRQSGKHAGQALSGYPMGGLESWKDQDQLAANFSKRDGKPIALALDIEIGVAAQSTASREMQRIQQRTKNRKV